MAKKGKKEETLDDVFSEATPEVNTDAPNVVTPTDSTAGTAELTDSVTNQEVESSITDPETSGEESSTCNTEATEESQNRPAASDAPDPATTPEDAEVSDSESDEQDEQGEDAGAPNNKPKAAPERIRSWHFDYCEEQLGTRLRITRQWKDRKSPDLNDKEAKSEYDKEYNESSKALREACINRDEHMMAYSATLRNIQIEYPEISVGEIFDRCYEGVEMLPKRNPQDVKGQLKIDLKQGKTKKNGKVVDDGSEAEPASECVTVSGEQAEKILADPTITLDHIFEDSEPKTEEPLTEKKEHGAISAPEMFEEINSIAEQLKLEESALNDMFALHEYKNTDEPEVQLKAISAVLAELRQMQLDASPSQAPIDAGMSDLPDDTFFRVLEDRVYRSENQELIELLREVMLLGLCPNGCGPTQLRARWNYSDSPPVERLKIMAKELAAEAAERADALMKEKKKANKKNKKDAEATTGDAPAIVS